MSRFKRSLVAEVTDYLVDFHDDVLRDFELYRIAIDHVGIRYALFVILCWGYLAEDYEIFGYNNTESLVIF